MMWVNKTGIYSLEGSGNFINVFKNKLNIRKKRWEAFDSAVK